MLRDRLQHIRHATDTTAVFSELGYAPDARPFDQHATVVATWKGYRVIAVDDPEPRGRARALARALARTSTRALAVAVAAPHEMVLAAPKLGTAGTTRILVVPLREPSRATLHHLESFRPRPGDNGLAHALRVEELLASEEAGERFYSAFRLVLDRMAATLPRCADVADSRLAALLPLTRVLFLYFVQAKGWLDHRPDYLRSLLDDALSKRADFHRTALDPLFFVVLNRPPRARRGVAHLGRLPYLNGGLFDRHPLELRLTPQFSNALWRDAFDTVFEKFRFCVREATEVDAIAPDMLGRVFERVMDPDARQVTGTFYTPESVVRELVEATVGAALGGGDDETAEQVGRLLRPDWKMSRTGLPNRPRSAVCVPPAADVIAG